MIREAIRRTPLEPLAKWVGARIRYYRLRGSARMNMRYDAQTADIIRRIPGNYLDVGCSRGVILREMINASPTGRHVAFEPIPHLAKGLRDQFPSVEIHEVALSDTIGTVTFNYVRNDSGYSGIRMRDYPFEPDIELITVKTDTIDNLVHHSVQFIKIDVEGAELAVLKGGARTLREYLPTVVFEHGTAAKSYDGTSADIFELLEDCGLRVFLLHAWLTGHGNLSKREFVKQGTRGPHFYFIAAP